MLCLKDKMDRYDLDRHIKDPLTKSDLLNFSSSSVPTVRVGDIGSFSN